jgi:hypothetical protein
MREFTYGAFPALAGDAGALDTTKACRLRCTEVITIIRSGCRVSEARVKEYRQMLKEEGYEDVYARTVLLELPVFRSLPADVRSLGRGELASYLRPLAASLTEGRAG